MKIELDLTRAEALELHLLLLVGREHSKPGRTTFRAMSEWNRAFVKGMQE